MNGLKAGILAGVALLAACEKSATSNTPLSSAAEAAPAGVWSLQSFDLSGGQSVVVSDPAGYTLELAADGSTHVRADCNVCNGGYDLSGRALHIGLLACTRAACPPDSLDGDYLRALSSASSLEKSGDVLRIAYDGGVLRFAPE
jgi:heat shock protein HslJ